MGWPPNSHLKWQKKNNKKRKNNQQDFNRDFARLCRSLTSNPATCQPPPTGCFTNHKHEHEHYMHSHGWRGHWERGDGEQGDWRPTPQTTEPHVYRVATQYYIYIYIRKYSYLVIILQVDHVAFYSIQFRGKRRGGAGGQVADWWLRERRHG